MSTLARTRPARQPQVGSIRSTVVAATAVAALLLGGCSTGGDSADDATTTTGAEQTTSTASDSTETTVDGTTTTAAPGGEVTTEDLEALMPEAADIGPDYELTEDVEDEDDDSSETSTALEEQCPDAARFMSDDDGPSDAAYRMFSAADDREIEIKIDPTPNPNFDEDRIDAVIDAVNSCGTIEVQQNGFTMTLSIQATADDSYGDRGVVMSMAMLMEHPELPAPLEVEFSARAFVLGSVAVSLQSTDGFEQTADDIRIVPGDHHLLDSLAADLEPAVADVQS